MAVGPAADPEDEAVLADSVGLALLVVLDTLTPAERLAFVLHDMFAMPFTEVAAVLGRSTDATRQLASRARRRVRGAPSPDHAADLARQREVATAFLAAARGGDLSALVALLDSDVTLTADAGRRPVREADAAPGRRRGRPGRGRWPPAGPTSPSWPWWTGMWASSSRPAWQLQVVLAFTVSPDRRITAIDVIADPDRLRRLRLARAARMNAPPRRGLVILGHLRRFPARWPPCGAGWSTAAPSVRDEHLCR